jgi:hypothetical protein
VLELHGVPKGLEVAKLEAEIKEKLEARFGDQVKDVVVVPDKSKAHKRQAKAEKLKHDKENIEARDAAKGEPTFETYACGCCYKTVGALNAIDEKIRTNTLKLNIELEKFEGKSTETAFVICATEQDARSVGI